MKTHYCHLASEMIDPAYGFCEICELWDEKPLDNDLRLCYYNTIDYKKRKQIGNCKE